MDKNLANRQAIPLLPKVRKSMRTSFLSQFSGVSCSTILHETNFGHLFITTRNLNMPSGIELSET